MFKIFLTLLLLSVKGNILSQSSLQDHLVLKIPVANTYSTTGISDYIKANFSTDTTRVQAIYVWVTNNIAYDVPRVLAHKSNGGVPQSVEDVLKTRFAVCQGYAELFAELCNQCGIKAIVIGGYTKREGAISPLSHAWVGAELGSNWYLFDPTWGAGHVRNNKFVKSFNPSFYKVPPADMIKDHMPFDPMYQFLNHPLTNKEFIEGAVTSSTKPFFNYADTLQQHSRLSLADKMGNELRRLLANGVQNDLIQQRVNYLKKGTQSFASKNSYDEAGVAYKQAASLFKQYIDLKNKQFSAVSNDNDLKQMVDSVSYYLNQSKAILVTIVARDEANKQLLSATHQNVDKFQQQVVHEKEFVVRYINTEKSLRRQLFVRK